MVTRAPLTRLWFLTQAIRQADPGHAAQLMLAAPSLIPGINLTPARPGEYADRLALRTDDQATRDAIRQGDNTHEDPRDARAARRHMLGYWDRQR